MNHLGLTWRDVLDCYKSGREGNTIRDYLEKVVVPSGYKYFHWNGMVYKVSTEINWGTMKKIYVYKDTNIFAAELDG